MRRLLVILLLLAIGAAAVWTLLRWSRTTSPASDPWTAIPHRSALIVEIPDALATWDRFTHTSQHWSSIEQIPAVAAVGHLMAQAVARTENDAAFRGSLQGIPLLVAVMRTGSEQVDLLITCVPKVGSGVPMRTLAELLKVDEAAWNTLKDGGTVQCRPDTSLPALSVCVQQGICLVATSPAMMDEALLQLKNGHTITQEPLLREAMNTLGSGADAHVLVHLERAKAMLHTWWRPAELDAHESPTGWVALDLRARPDALLLSGLILPDTTHATLTTLAHQGTGRNDIGRHLPLEVAAWDVRQIHDGERFLRDLGVGSDSIITSWGPNLFNWVDGCIGIAQSADTASHGARTWALFQTSDPEGAAKEINALCPDGVHCDTLHHRGTRLTQLPVSHAYERLLGPAYAAFDRPWWSILGDVIVLAPTPEVLHTAIDAWNDGRTLAEDARTNAWTERIASTAGRTLRWDIARYGPRLGGGLKPEIAATFNTQQAIWQRMGGLAVQLSPGQHGRTHLTIGLEHAPAERHSSGIHWSTPVPPGVNRVPDILLNHTNNTREVLVQDAEHTIHLLSSSGKVLWKYPLDGPIMGEVHQVDRFKNGKLQLLLNTAGHIHLIDRNGKDVGGFPIKLPQQATAPLAVFDYEKNKEYRIVIGLADGRVVNYGMDGASTTGWEAPQLGDPTTNAVRHLRIKNKDHLLLVDGRGRVKLLDRRGNEREHTQLELGSGARVLQVLPGLELNTSRILWADTTGTLYDATLNGAPKALCSAGNNTLGDLGDDGNFDIMRIRADSLIVTHGSQQVLSRSFGAALGPQVHRYGSATGKYYGVLFPQRGQVTLLDDSGRELEGFPLPGTTLFNIADLDLDGVLELVTLTADGQVVAYNAWPSTRVVR
ncbi:MAG: hypothetical protein E6Q44_15205 [Flavobacteriales bacterium]|nr:MAG: hypothetical protein E6Q44_15205 [Flavobacteriales bacterium]